MISRCRRFVLLAVFIITTVLFAGDYKKEAYDPSWESLIQHPTPDWFKDAAVSSYLLFS